MNLDLKESVYGVNVTNNGEPIMLVSHEGISLIGSKIINARKTTVGSIIQPKEKTDCQIALESTGIGDVYIKVTIDGGSFSSIGVIKEIKDKLYFVPWKFLNTTTTFKIVSSCLAMRKNAGGIFSVLVI